MRHLIRRTCRLVSLLGLSLAPLAGCEVLAPADDPPPPPPPTWVASQPEADVRDLADVVMLPSGVAFAVGTDGAILRIDEARVTREDSGTTEDLNGISAVLDPDGEPVMLASGANGTVLVYQGGAWSALESGTTKFLFSTWLVSPTNGFIVGDSGTILRFDGTAVTLMDAQSEQPVDITDPNGNPAIGWFPIPDALKGVAGSGNTVWAVGSGGAVFRFDAGADPADLNNRWTAEDSTTQRPLGALYSRAGLWAPTIDGVVVRSGGDGAWDDDFRGPVPVFLQDVWVAEGEVYLVGLVDKLYHRHVKDAGEDTERTAWDAVSLEETAHLRAIDGVVIPPDPDDEEDEPEWRVVAVGGGGRIVRGPRVLATGDEERLVVTEIEPIQ